MSNKNQRQAGMARIITTVIIVLLLIFAVGFLAKFTNGFTTDVKTFYVETDGEKILSDKTDFTVSETGTKFSVKYTFGGKNQKAGYTVQVVPNASADFTFSDASGRKYKFSEIKDLTDAFEIDKQDSYFVIKNEKSLYDVLAEYYPDVPLSGVPSEMKSYYTLIVWNADKTASVRVSFKNQSDAIRITISPEQVIF